MKSAIGIGALLMDGLGDTIRVSLTGAWQPRACCERARVRVTRGGGECGV
jgi:4-hydroxy-3-methylbut-2-en-1-yl diphosphate synthase IspG/GcpE